MPIDFLELELCLEWGIPYQGTSFLDTPAEIIDKILDYKKAKQMGLAYQAKVAENKRKLDNS